VPFFAAALLDGTALLPDEYAATNSVCYVDPFEDCPHGGKHSIHRTFQIIVFLRITVLQAAVSLSPDPVSPGLQS
jgi:hypothetical protein